MYNQIFCAVLYASAVIKVLRAQTKRKMLALAAFGAFAPCSGLSLRTRTQTKHLPRV
jgi:hypothetical protein